MDDADTFFDPFATVYDARMARVGGDDGSMSTDDLVFYREFARGVDGPALEIGVGTDRVYLDLLAAGLDVDGVDRSRGKIERCRATADERGLVPLRAER